MSSTEQISWWSMILKQGARFNVDLRVCTSPGERSMARKYRLVFNRDLQEWLVLVENLNNPKGNIGFLN